MCRKLRDPEELQEEIKKEREERERKEREKERRREEERRKQREKEEQARIPPEEYFKHGKYEGVFSAYDNRGLPTHFADGTEVGSSRRKKLDKELSSHIQQHEKQVQLDNASQ